MPQPEDRLETTGFDDTDYARDALMDVNLGSSAVYYVRKRLQEWIGGSKDWIVVLPEGVNAKLGVTFAAKGIQNALHDADIESLGEHGTGVFIIEAGEEWLLEKVRDMPDACLWDRELGRTPSLMQEDAIKRHAAAEDGAQSIAA